MELHLKHVVLALFIGIALESCEGDPYRESLAGDYAFVGVDVVAVDSGGILPAQTVVVKGSQIIALAPSDAVELSADTRVIDGRGLHLAPGLADMHVHIQDDLEPPIYVAYGITTVRNLWGEAITLAMRERIRRGELLGPDMTTTGRILDAPPRMWDGSEEVATPEAAVSVVKQQIADGYDYIKIYNNLSPETFDAIAAVAHEAGVPFIGHVPLAVSMEHALRSGMSSIEHLTGFMKTVTVEGVNLGRGFRPPEMLEIARQVNAGELPKDQVFDAGKLRQIALLTAEQGVWNVPTLIIRKNLLLTDAVIQRKSRRPEMAYMAPMIRLSWLSTNQPWRSANALDEEGESAAVANALPDDELGDMQVFFDEYLAQVLALHQAGAKI
ncbi:MAG: hypothetical protein EXR85_01120, partial [Xanthomonadales bacterium]|nr:hypothetical protein [Xanthomonadales bacterium]